MSVFDRRRLILNSKYRALGVNDYDSLPIEDKRNSTSYIVGRPDNRYQKIRYAMKVIGSIYDFVDVSDGTIVGAIKEFYRRLGDCTINVDSESDNLVISYEPIPPAHNEPVVIDNMTDDEKVDALLAILGDYLDLNLTGNVTIGGAIKDLDERFNGFCIAADPNTMEAIIIKEDKY